MGALKKGLIDKLGFLWKILRYFDRNLKRLHKWPQCVFIKVCGVFKNPIFSLIKCVID